MRKAGSAEGSPMDDHEILQHLLDLENEAAAMVNDAQAEADRRVTEGEKQNRANYDGVYAAEIAALDASFAESIAAVKEEYKKQLEEYHKSLKSVSLDMAAFSELAEELLLKTAPPAGKP